MSNLQFKTWIEEVDHGTAIMLVLNQGKVLILQRGPTADWMPGMWNLPGGGIEKGERPVQAAIRECQEEAGITPVNIKPFTVIHDKDYTLHFFLGETNVIKPRMNFESSAFAWADLDNIHQYRFVPYVEQTVTKILNSVQSAVVTH